MNARLQEIESVTRVLDSRELELACADAHREDRRWAEAVLAGEKRVLEMIAGGNALASVLDALCQVAEETSCGSLCSILLLDPKGERLWQGAAPSLPKSYTEEFNGREIASCWGPCGMAAFRKEQVIAADIPGGSSLGALSRAALVPRAAGLLVHANFFVRGQSIRHVRDPLARAQQPLFKGPKAHRTVHPPRQHSHRALAR